jgi:hypothetical protein
MEETGVWMWNLNLIKIVAIIDHIFKPLLVSGNVAIKICNTFAWSTWLGSTELWTVQRNDRRNCGIYPFRLSKKLIKCGEKKFHKLHRFLNKEEKILKDILLDSYNVILKCKPEYKRSLGRPIKSCKDLSVICIYVSVCPNGTWWGWWWLWWSMTRLYCIHRHSVANLLIVC